MAFSDYVIADLCFLLVIYVTTHDCQIIFHTGLSPVSVDGRHLVDPTSGNSSSSPNIANDTDVTSATVIGGLFWSTTAYASISDSISTSGVTLTSAIPSTTVTTTSVQNISAYEPWTKSDVVGEIKVEYIAAVVIDGPENEVTTIETIHPNLSTPTPPLGNTTDVTVDPSAENRHRVTSHSITAGPLPSSPENRNPHSSQTGNGFRSFGTKKLLPLSTKPGHPGRFATSQSGAGKRVGRKRYRPRVPAPTHWHRTPIQPGAGKWSRRNDIDSARKQFKYNFYLFASSPPFNSAVLTSSQTTTTATTNNQTGNGTNRAEPQKSTSGQRYQQLVLGAGIICSLASGGALIALIGVTVARCRSALSTWQRSDSIAELGHAVTSPEIPETTRRSVHHIGVVASSSSSDDSSGVFAYFRQRLRDYCFRLTTGFGTRLVGGRFDSPEGERKLGDGVESFQSMNDSAQTGNTSNGLKEMSAHDGTAARVLTFITSPGANMGSPLLPSGSYVHAPPPVRPRLFQTRRCPQPSVQHGAGRLASLSSSKNAMKKASSIVCQNTTQPIRLSSTVSSNSSSIVKLGLSRESTASVGPSTVAAAAVAVTGDYHTERTLCPLNVQQLNRDTNSSATPFKILHNQHCDRDMETQVDSKDYDSESTSAELNDVMRESDILKSFQRVAPPRNSKSEKRLGLSRHSPGENSS